MVLCGAFWGVFGRAFCGQLCVEFLWAFGGDSGRHFGGYLEDFFGGHLGAYILVASLPNTHNEVVFFIPSSNK